MSDTHTGSSFDDFLEDEGILQEVAASAWKRLDDWLRAYQPNTGNEWLDAAMKATLDADLPLDGFVGRVEAPPKK